MMVGIYKITNLINGKVYIGQSVDIKTRWRRHRTDAARETNLLLYRAINKYGIDNFSFEIIEECQQQELDEKEIYWIEYYDSYNPDKGYNLTKGGQGAKHFNKLNQQSLEEIKSLIKNSDMLLIDIAKLYHVSIITIKDINQGHSWFDENEIYPLRQTRNIKHYCITCGKEIHKGSKFCYDCNIKRVRDNSLLQRTVERPSREELKNLIRTIPFTQIGKLYGVSDNAIRKWCDFENLPRRKIDINKYSDEEWELI